MSLVLDEHRQYLADLSRIEAFRLAIHEVVKPGDVVLDLASGTGILGLLACKAGAERVYSIEVGPMIGLAHEISKANGFADRTTFIKGLSSHVNLPQRVDVVVADQIGNFGFNAGILEYFNDARERFLKPGGAMIPSCMELYVAPVNCPTIFDNIEFWNRSPAGFEFGPARTIAANTGYQVKFHSEDLMGEPVRLTSIDLSTATEVPIVVNSSVTIERNGTLHGIGGWFTASLSRNVSISNSPLAEYPIERRQVFFPIDRPVSVSKGDCVQIRMQILPHDLVVNWTITVVKSAPNQTSADRAVTFRHSTWKGMLFCNEDLERTRPVSIPRLSPRGLGRLSVLELCDGQKSLSEIEKEVYRRHPALFGSLDEAAVFVAEVVTRYSL